MGPDQVAIQRSLQPFIAAEGGLLSEIAASKVLPVVRNRSGNRIAGSNVRCFGGAEFVDLLRPRPEKIPSPSMSWQIITAEEKPTPISPCILHHLPLDFIVVGLVSDN